MRARRSFRQSILNIISYCLAITNRAPFIWLYNILATAAIHAAVHYLKRGAMVRSIYLIRGFARGEAVYGQSDIDFLVVVKEEATVNTVVSRYQNLARICPLFDKTHGVASFEKMQSIYRQYDLCKYRYNIDAGHWKLLYGDDIRKCFSESITGPLRDRSLLAELCKTWNTLANNIRSDHLPGFKINYLLRKFEPETRRILACRDLTECGREVVSKDWNSDSETASNGAGGRQPVRAAVLTEAGRNALRPDKGGNDVLLRSGMRRIDDFSRSIAEAYQKCRNGGIPISVTFSATDLPVSSTARDCISALQSHLEHAGWNPERMIVLPRVLAPSLCALLNPRVETLIENDILSYLGIDDVCLYVPCESGSSLISLMRWAAVPMLEHVLQRIDLYVVFPCTAFCLTNVGAFWDARPSIQNPVNSPVELFLMSRSGMMNAGHGIEYGICPGEMALALERRALEDLAMIHNQVSSGYPNSEPAGRFKLFFHLLQRVFLIEGIRKSCLDLPLTSRGLTRRLQEQASNASDWAGELQSAWENILDGAPGASRTESMLVAKAMSFIQEKIQSLNGPGKDHL